MCTLPTVLSSTLPYSTAQSTPYALYTFGSGVLFEPTESIRGSSFASDECDDDDLSGECKYEEAHGKGRNVGRDERNDESARPAHAAEDEV